MVLNATFNNILVISWRSVLLVEGTGGPGENHHNMVKYAREQFLINVNDMLDNEGKSNPKTYRGLLKKLMGKSTVSPISPLQNEATGEFVVNDEDKANLLNTFFC
jgi:hypothetical protein